MALAAAWAGPPRATKAPVPRNAPKAARVARPRPAVDVCRVCCVVRRRESLVATMDSPRAWTSDHAGERVEVMSRPPSGRPLPWQQTRGNYVHGPPLDCSFPDTEPDSPVGSGTAVLGLWTVG